MDAEAGELTAEINYLAEGSFINRRYVAPGVEFNTGVYEPHRVTIRNARPRREAFTLDSCGFALADHKSGVADFFDKAEVEAIYPGEVMETVKALTGADLVLPRGWMVRTSGDPAAAAPRAAGPYTHQGGVQPPASDVHVDFVPSRAEGLAAATYQKLAPGGAPYRRFIASSFWRCFSTPPQDQPLAVCDGRSVGAGEGTANTLVVVDELPEPAAMVGDLPCEDQMLAAAVFRYNPDHRWWWFPDMTRDEALIFKFHDSDQTRPWRVPHTAFRDPSHPGAGPRHSIEFRTIAYFL